MVPRTGLTARHSVGSGGGRLGGGRCAGLGEGDAAGKAAVVFFPGGVRDSLNYRSLAGRSTLR